MQYIHRKDVINPSYLSRLNKIVGGQNGFPWYFISEDISYQTNKDIKFGNVELLDIPDEQKSIGFVHVLLDLGGVESPWLPHFAPLMDSIADVFPHPIEFFRVRLALTVHDGQEEGGHNGPHTDHESDHYAALFYIYNSSGNTTFFKEYDDPSNGDLEMRWWRATTQEYHPIKRVEPVANRLFVFDGHQFHASANPNPVDKYRVVCNFNFRCEHDLFDT